MYTYQTNTEEITMAEQNEAHHHVHSQNKAMKFDREKRQERIKVNLELHKDTQNKIKSVMDKLVNDNKQSEEEAKQNIKNICTSFFSETKVDTGIKT